MATSFFLDSLFVLPFSYNMNNETKPQETGLSPRARTLISSLPQGYLSDRELGAALRASGSFRESLSLLRELCDHGSLRGRGDSWEVLP